jgi:hypothetical protein
VQGSYYETQEACHRSETGPTEEREVKRAKRKSEINVMPVLVAILCQKPKTISKITEDSYQCD